MKAFSTLWQLLRQEPLAPQLGLMVLMTLVAMTEGIGLLLLVPIIDQVQNGTRTQNPVIHYIVDSLGILGIPVTLQGLLAVFIGLILFREILRYGKDVITTAMQFQIVDHNRSRCLERIMQAEWAYVSRHDQAYYANALITDVNRIGMGLRFALNSLSLTVIMVLYLVAALALSVSMTLASLAGALVLMLLMGTLRRRATTLGHQVSHSNTAVHSSVQESLGGMKQAKILGHESRLHDQFRDNLQQLRHQQVRFQMGSSAANGLMQVGGAILIVMYLYAGLRFGNVPLAELTVLVLILARVIPMFSSLQQFLLQWLHALPAIENVIALQHTHQQAAEPAPTTRQSIPPPHRDIRLQDVSFRYAGRDEPGLRQVSLALPVGAITVLTGPSGAGKSTLADILMGLLVPDSGNILLDGVPLTGEQRLHWRHQVAYVPQDTFLFNDSVRRNLQWARPDASDTEMHASLHKAAAEFVLQLPEGLDTRVGDRGLQLSGGERQRIALARALLWQPSLLILDEATSALDLQNTTRVLDAIEALRGQLTVLLITHQDAAQARADQIIHLDQGRVTGVHQASQKYPPFTKPKARLLD